MAASHQDAIAQLLDQGAARLAMPLAHTTLDSVCVYLDELQRWSRIVNLVSVPDPQTVIRKHVLDCLALASQLSFEGRLVDLGSGAGFPGLILAMLDPGRPVGLIEARRKRAHFLKAVVRRLGLRNVKVYEGRAETLVQQERFRAAYRVAVSRATWNLAQFLSLVQGFVEPDGCAAIIDPERWEAPPIFDFLRERGEVPEADMYRTFNMGIGLVVVCGRDDAHRVVTKLITCGEIGAGLIGKVVEAGDGQPLVQYAPAELPGDGGAACGP